MFENFLFYPLSRKQAEQKAILAALLIILLMQIQINSKLIHTQVSSNVLETNFGKLRGLLVHFPKTNLPSVEVYLGLQYASLLGGELRFMPPTTSAEKWDNIRVASNFKPVCPQRFFSRSGSENSEKHFLHRHPMPDSRYQMLKKIRSFAGTQSEECLYLNIFAPVRERNETNLPVLVFIHGENFDEGTGNSYDGSVLSSFGNIIVVTINYRVGPLGFLNTGDNRITGNFAILDIVAALHWIRENIQSFSGDPNSVTLLGHNYGASLVHILLVTPLTKGRHLFHKAVILSGSAFASYAITDNPLRYAMELAIKFNCTGLNQDDPDTAAILECFKKRSLEDFSRWSGTVWAPKYLSAFGPSVDKRSVLPFGVEKLTEIAAAPTSGSSTSAFKATRLLLGFSRNDGSWRLSQQQSEAGLTAEQAARILRTYVQNCFDYNRQHILEILQHHYHDWDKPDQDPSSIRDLVAELLADGQSVAPVIRLAKLHAKVASTYLFALHYPTRSELVQKLSDGSGFGRLGSNNLYGDDLALFFGAPLVDGVDPWPNIGSRADRIMSEVLMRALVNFVTTGNPNTQPGRSKVKPSQADSDWPIYDPEKQQLAVIERKVQERMEDVLKHGVRHHYKSSKMALWLNLIPKLHRNIFQLESRFHQLGDHDNLFTFESNVTRFFIDTGSKRDQDLNDTSDHKQLPHVPHFDPPKLSPSDYHRNHNHFTHPSLEINGYDGAGLQSHVVNLNLSKSSSPTVVTPRHEQSTFAVAIPFIATITVGLALFCCNFVMFCAVCRQKAQLQKERMMMKLEISSRSHGDTLRSSVSPNLRKHRSMTESSLKSDKDDTAFVIRTRDDPTIFHPSSPSFFSSPTRSSNTSPNLDFQDKSTESGSGIDVPLGDYSYGRQSLIRQSSKKSRVQFSRPESETLKFVGETRFIHHSSATVTSLTSSKLSNFPAPSANLKSVTFPVTSGVLYQHKIPPPCFSQPGSTTLTNVRQQQQQQHFRDQTLQQQKTRSILMNGGFHLATLPRQQSPKQQQQTSIVIPNAQQPQQHSTSFADAANNNTLTRQQHQQEVQDPHEEMEQKYCDEQPSTVV